MRPNASLLSCVLRPCGRNNFYFCIRIEIIMASVSFVVLICISPFECACFGYSHSQPHFVCVCVSLSTFCLCLFLMSNSWNVSSWSAAAPEGNQGRKYVLQITFHFEMCMFWKPFFFAFYFYTHIEFICRRCDHIVFIWLFFNIVYTHVDGLCAHTFPLHFYFSSDAALISDLYGKFTFFFSSKCMRFTLKCSPIMHSRPFVVLSLAFHFVAIVAVTATTPPPSPVQCV